MFEKAIFALPIFGCVYGAIFGVHIDGITQGDSLICAVIIWGTYMLKKGAET